MNTLKFIGGDNQQRLFSEAVRKNVNEYFKGKGLSIKGDGSMALKTMAMLSLYLAPFVLILTVSMGIWVALLMTLIMGIGMAGIGMSVMHDAVHGSYASKEWINKVLGGTLYLLGSHVLNWKIQHNLLHHTYTNIEGYDQDIASKGPIRLSQHAPLRKIHRNQYIHGFLFYGLMTLSKLIRDFTQLPEFNKAGLLRNHPVNPTTAYLKMVSLKAFYLVVIIGLPILFTPFYWWQVMVGFFIMHWVAGCILSTVFQMAHVVEGAEQPLPDKEGCLKGEWAVHQLRTTSDFARDNLFLNWYIGGLNFQIEHHLFPHICHIHYRNIAPIVEKTAKEFGMPYNVKPTFLNALSSHVKRLKELGREIKKPSDQASAIG